MYLLKYPGMTVENKPGRDMLIADCLSRAQLSTVEELPELSQMVHSITRAACLSEDNYKLYQSTMAGNDKLN